MTAVVVLGRDSVGAVAMADGSTYYITDCCGASAKGLEHYVGCRACYQPVNTSMGNVPDMTLTIDHTKQGAERFVFVQHPIAFVEVYGDGISYEQWKAQYLGVAR